jgi:hypothetical protein
MFHIKESQLILPTAVSRRYCSSTSMYRYCLIRNWYFPERQAPIPLPSILVKASPALGTVSGSPKRQLHPVREDPQLRGLSA